MRANANVPPLRKGKSRLLASGAVAAVLIALAHGGPVRAQVAANPTVVQGGATINSNTGTSTTTVTLTQSQNVINWVPTDTAETGGAIDLLPAENNWRFQSTDDFLVLNRFIDGTGTPLSRQIAISGNVTSTPGGSVWFYNAGGILINGGATINVGSLVLTTNDINRDNGLIDDGGVIHFHESRSGTAEIAIARNASITVANGTPRGAYLALVAPRIRQSGAVTIDGSAAYVAAEEASIRFSDGLFDIDVTVGADGGTALVHDGSTTGPPHMTSVIPRSGVYMVAVPKNDAVSMLVSGQVGYYDAVTAAADPNGVVVLSGGYGVSGGQIADYVPNDIAADISITDAHFHGNTQIHASGTLLAGPAEPAPPSGPPSEGRIIVDGNAVFAGDRGAALNMGNGHVVTVHGDLTVRSAGPGGARVQVNGGELTVDGTLAVSADASGGSINDPDGVDAQGGTASIHLAGGEISAAHIMASANGSGGAGRDGGDGGPVVVPGEDGGAGRGGTAVIAIDGTADVDTGSIAAYAIGEGGGGGGFQSGLGISGATGRGGEGRGGTASVTVALAAEGAVTATDLTVDASGIGGAGGEYYSFSSGPSTGGSIGARGGDGYGGTATIALASPITAVSQMNATAQAMGGSGGNHDIGGDGGNAFGGTAQAIVTGFDAGYRPFDFSVIAEGGSGGYGQDGAGGNGGRAVGGTARATASGTFGRIAVAASNFSTQAYGGSGGDGGLSPFAADVAVAPSGGRGGDGIGGTIEVVATNGANLFVSAENSSPGALLSSLGQGGGGGVGSPNFSGASGIGGDGGEGGSGIGGTVRLIANGGTVSRGSSGPLSIIVRGEAGESGYGGEGPGGRGADGPESVTTGGRVLIEANNNSGFPGRVELGAASIDANGDQAGRVVLGGNGAIHAVSLDIRTRGTAATTTGDVSQATAGIFLAPTGTGSITTDGAMQLLSDGSIGVHAQAGATVAAGGALTLEAGDEVDIRHASRTAGTPTMRSLTGALSISAATGINAATGSLLAAGTTLSLTTTGTGSAISAGGLDATDIAINATGAALVDQIDARGNVTVNAASVRTGRNTAGGDIVITSPGAVDLGNSSARGLVSVDGLSIAFASIAADSTVRLNASGTGEMAGGSIDAAGATITTNGALSLDEAETSGNFTVSAASVRTGRNTVGGDIVITSPGAVDLGRSSAGGLVSVDGQSIAFTSIAAASTVDLHTSGAGGITGQSINAAAITIGAGGAASIDHAEATGNFTASAASFRTGLNSIITGGDIVITSPGAVDLGNSSAGGLVSVNGLSILFNSIVAGSTVGLSASGADGIAGGSIDAGDDITLSANRIVLTGPVSGDASLAAYATGGPAAIDQSNVAGSITVIASGDIGGNYIAGGNVTLSSGANVTASAAANGGYVDGNGIVADGNLFVLAAGDAVLTNASARRMVGVSAGQAASIASGSAGEDLLLLGGTTAALTGFTAGDDIRIEAPGTVTAQNVATTGAGADTANIQLSPSTGFTIVTAAADGADITLLSTGGAIGGANVSAAGDLTGDAATGITGGAFAAIGNLALTAGTAIDVAGAAGGTVALAGTTGVTAGAVASQGATSLLSGGGAVDIDTLSSLGPIVAIAESIRVGDGGDLNFTNLTAETGDAVVHTGGDLTIASALVAGTADLSSDGDALAVASLEAASATLRAANGTITLGSATVTNSLEAQANGLLTIGDLLTANSVDLISGDIAIGSAGRVSTSGPGQSIRFTNGNAAQQAFVGGTGTRSGYHIDANELTRLYSQSIMIGGVGVFPGGPDVIVDSFTLAGGTTGSNLGTDGSLSIRANQLLRVVGDVRLTGLSDANRLTLVSGANVEIPVGQGTVRLLDASGAPGGLLEIRGARIFVATPGAIADIASAPNLDAIEARLAQNDGIVLDEGSLFARGIRFNSNVYVQNSGSGSAYAQRRGLTFGAGGLDVSPDGAAQIVLNGVHLGPDGQITGLDTVALLTIRGNRPTDATAYFNLRSTFNGCLIANPMACLAAVRIGSDYPVQNVIEEKDGIEGGEGDEGDGIALPTALITLRALDPLTGEPLVDDPVTGAGNDDLWGPPGE